MSTSELPLHAVDVYLVLYRDRLFFKLTRGQVILPQLPRAKQNTKLLVDKTGWVLDERIYKIGSVEWEWPADWASTDQKRKLRKEFRGIDMDFYVCRALDISNPLPESPWRGKHWVKWPEVLEQIRALERNPVHTHLLYFLSLLSAAQIPSKKRKT